MENLERSEIAPNLFSLDFPCNSGTPLHFSSLEIGTYVAFDVCTWYRGRFVFTACLMRQVQIGRRLKGVIQPFLKLDLVRHR